MDELVIERDDVVDTEGEVTGGLTDATVPEDLGSVDGLGDVPPDDVQAAALATTAAHAANAANVRILPTLR